MRSYILLDRSGSMQARWGETIAALNSYVDGLAKEKSTEKTKVSVFTFDGTDSLDFNILRDGVRATDWKNIELHEDSPRGMTPLLDAIGRMKGEIDKKSPKKASVVIMTDGGENGSREVKKESAKAMLDEMRDKKGYDVVFIGADFDAFGEAGGLGNAMAHTLNTSAGSYAGAMKGLAAKTVFYADTGTVRAFSDEERTQAGS
jgi:Mg-chelatase subunit ChlD